MSRVKKLLIVTFVLAIGIGMALPFRRQAGDSVQPLPVDNPLQTSERTDSYERLDPTANGSARLGNQRSKQVEAHMASTRDDELTAGRTNGFDLADHPALATRPATARKDRAASQLDQSSKVQTQDTFEQSPVTPQTLPGAGHARPAYATTLPTESDAAAWPEELIHVVHNGDTLEKLAERYLGDSGRALELFDLNREQLSNPHLLPIGAELRIPVPPRREND